MSRYLGDKEVKRAVEMCLDHLADGEKLRQDKEYVERLERVAHEIAAEIEGTLDRVQGWGKGAGTSRVLLYCLLAQLPVLHFEPLNYCFVRRVAIPLQDVLDLLINLDLYLKGEPVYKGSLPGELQPMPAAASTRARGVSDIAGIGPTYAALLREKADVQTTQDLLEKGATAQGRAELAQKTGVSEKLISKWVRRANLMRIEGVGAEYGELLEASGVKSISGLARRNPDSLYQKLREINDARHLVQRLPSLEDVKDWIAQAREIVGRDEIT